MPDHPRAHILAMHVADATNMPGQHRHRVATGKSHVAAVEKKAYAFARQRHKPIDVGGGLDIRAHVMVICNADTAEKRVLRERVELVGVVAPLLRMEEARPLV